MRSVFFLCLLVLGSLVADSSVSQRALAADQYPEPRGYVNDFANTIESATQNRLERFLTAVDQRLGVQVAVVTMRDLGGDDPTEYANRLFEAWGIGDADSNRGLLILDAKRERFLRVEVGYGLEGVLPDGKVGRILDSSVMPYLRNGQDELAYVSATRELLRPVLIEAGQDPEALEELVSDAGYSLRRRRGSQPFKIVPFLVILFVIWAASRGGGRGGGGLLPYLILTSGGRGGFGGGGGGFGGFGGFGGGMSGGGGAGRGY